MPNSKAGLRSARSAALSLLGAAACTICALSGAAPAHATTAPAPTTTTAAPAPQTAGPSPLEAESYSVLTATGNLIGFGPAVSGSASPASAAAVGVATTPDGHGAWIAEADGTVATVGDAVSHGSMAGTHLQKPIVGIAADPATGGYWLVASDGGIFSFGAPFFGSTGGIRLNQPIVGMSATPDGGGYRLVASDGGIFDFGDAKFYGSTGGIRLNQPIVGMAPTSDGHGYWLVASDGGIFTFGDASFHGSTGNVHLVQPVVGMAPTPAGDGYWLVAADGGVFTFGKAVFQGSAANAGQRVVGLAVGYGGYQNPLRAVTGLRPERVDQGVDYGGAGPIYAVGDGVITNTVNSGWPGGAFISYKLLDGPAKGLYVYVAENVIPKVAVGQVVNSSTVIGILVNAYPDMETGWANPPGLGNAAAGAAGQWNSTADSKDLPTAYGLNFSQFLSALGAPPGLASGSPIGTLPGTWPTW